MAEPARAAEPEQQEKARVTYAAPEGCPDSAAFLQRIRERIGTDWEATGEELARTIDVQVSVAPDGFAAKIAFADAEGRRVERSVGGARCAEVVEGIALVTALAIRAQVVEPEPETAPAETAPRPEPAPSPRSAPAKPRPTAPRVAARRGVRSRRSLHVRVGGRVLGETAVGPGLSLGFGGFFGVESPIGVAEVVLDATRTGRVVSNGVPASFVMIGVRADACAAFPVVDGVGFEFGPFVRGGVLRAEAALDPPVVTRSATGTAPWIASGMLARLAGRRGPLFASLELDGRVPLVRRQFYVQQGGQRAVVYGVPSAGVGAALGLGLHF